MIKEVCLEEARVHFTQANDTPFLTPPLVSELGLLNCHATPFDEIAVGTYQPSAGTYPIEVAPGSYGLQLKSDQNHSL